MEHAAAGTDIENSHGTCSSWYSVHITLSNCLVIVVAKLNNCRVPSSGFYRMFFVSLCTLHMIFIIFTLVELTSTGWKDDNSTADAATAFLTPPSQYILQTVQRHAEQLTGVPLVGRGGGDGSNHSPPLSLALTLPPYCRLTTTKWFVVGQVDHAQNGWAVVRLIEGEEGGGGGWGWYEYVGGGGLPV